MRSTTGPLPPCGSRRRGRGSSRVRARKPCSILPTPDLNAQGLLARLLPLASAGGGRTLIRASDGGRRMQRLPRDPRDDYSPRQPSRAVAWSVTRPGRPSSTWLPSRSTPRSSRGTWRASPAWPRCPWVSPDRCWWTASTPTAILRPDGHTEGTLVASYSRGMRLTREAGGSRRPCSMTRCSGHRSSCSTTPGGARFRELGERQFRRHQGGGRDDHPVGKLRDIEQYAVGAMRWLRFNFTTGDAAGRTW